MNWLDVLYSSYDKVYVKPSAETVRFENSKGWYEEAILTQELAFWILTKGMEVRYE